MYAEIQGYLEKIVLKLDGCKLNHSEMFVTKYLKDASRATHLEFQLFSDNKGQKEWYQNKNCGS